MNEKKQSQTTENKWWFKSSIFFPIILSILIIIFTITLSFMLYSINLENSYYVDMNFWCYNDFYCDENCPSANSPCFNSNFTSGTTGLANCLFGPTSNLFSNNFNEKTGFNYNCAYENQENTNCFGSNCALNLNDVPSNNQQAFCC